MNRSVYITLLVALCAFVALLALLIFLRMPSKQTAPNVAAFSASPSGSKITDSDDSSITLGSLDAENNHAPASWEELVADAVRDGRSTFGTTMVEEFGVMRSPDPDVIPLVSHDGIITYQAMADIGISKEEAVLVQAEIEAADAAMAAVARTHTKKDACDPTDTEDTTCYTISPYPDEGSEVLRQFDERLSELIGQERGRKVITSFINSMRFADFGKFEVYARFQDFRDENALPSSNLHEDIYLRVNYAIINPESGKRIGGGTDTYDGFSRQFGDIFSVQEEVPYKDRQY